MFCMNCGHEIEENATKCSRCGTPVSPHSGNAMQDTRIESYGDKKIQQMSKYYHIVIGIIAIVLGSFGVHKFFNGTSFDLDIIRYLLLDVHPFNYWHC